MRHLTVQKGLAIAAGASSPAGTTGDAVWSTTENDWLYWDGAAWVNADSGGGGGGGLTHAQVMSRGALRP